MPRVQFINIETYPGWLELPLTRTNFHGPKPVRATEALLYSIHHFNLVTFSQITVYNCPKNFTHCEF